MNDLSMYPSQRPMNDLMYVPPRQPMNDLSILCTPQATNEVVTRVPEATSAEMQAAVDAASAAYPKWADTTVLTRQQIMFKYQQLIKDNMVIGTLFRLE